MRLDQPGAGAPTTKDDIVRHKAAVRARVWRDLRAVAVPDSRFHLDFASFIPDFEGSRAATAALLARPEFRRGRCVFIAPDNCLEHLRARALAAGVTVLVTTYGIRRGFWLLDPAVLLDEAGGGGEDAGEQGRGDDEPALLFRYAATLDGMEKVGRSVTLRDLVGLDLEVGLMVTGAGAINEKGVRFGKGHGYFDLEWGMLFSIGVVGPDKTTTAAVVHDCQLLEGEDLVPEQFDVVCDLVVTPTRLIKAGEGVDGGVSTTGINKPDCGILWDRLADGMLDGIPPLQELKDARPGGPASRA